MAAIPINDNTPRNQYTATASQTTFAYTFWVYAETDLLVYVNGVLKTLTTDYTVSAVQSDTGANIVFNSGLALNDVVTISRSTAQTRLTGYTTAGSFRAETVNFELGRFLAMIQDTDKRVDRSFTLPDTSTSAPSLSIPDPQASKLLGWNSAANALENKEPTVLGATALPSVTGKDGWLATVDESGGTLAWLETLSTDYIDDDAVTLAKMAAGTAGNLITFDASGDPAVVATGTSGQVLTSNGAGAAPTFQAIPASVFSSSYTSSEQTITAAGSLTLAHSLGAQPKLVTAKLVCKTAEAGYSINDEVYIDAGGMHLVGSTTLPRGMSLVIDATNVNVRFGNQANTFNLLNKTTGNATAITNTNWKLVIGAYA